MVFKRDLTPENSFSGRRPKVSEVLCTFSYLKKAPFLYLSLPSSLDRAAARKCLVIDSPMYQYFFLSHLIFGWLLNNMLEICQNPLGGT